jgi:hypothetical protein
VQVFENVPRARGAAAARYRKVGGVPLAIWRTISSGGYGGTGKQRHVDEVVIEQPPDQGAAAVHLQLTRRLRFQLADGRRDVAGEDGRVRPARSVSVFDTRYLGFVFKASVIGWLPGSSAAARARSSAPQ